MKVDILTCVANGMPFVRHHLPVFKGLTMHWHWHIFEGISRLPHRSAANPWWPIGTIVPDMHRNGLSVDGTTEYLNEVANNPNVTVYRVLDWESMYLTDRFQQMLSRITEPTLVIALDIDEYWTTTQIETMERMFSKRPEKTAAWFRCRYFVGPKIMLPRRDYGPGGCLNQEWKRAWRYKPGYTYTQHDPPVVLDNNGADVFQTNPFLHDETESAGLVFNHYAYVTEAQVRFKERRYAFRGALEEWRRLQTSELPARLELLVGGNGGGACPVIAAPQEHWFKEE